jgi:hypothetical protein
MMTYMKPGYRHALFRVWQMITKVARTKNSFESVTMSQTRTEIHIETKEIIVVNSGARSLPNPSAEQDKSPYNLRSKT